MRERGWVAARVLVPTAGANNEVVAKFEYPDLATFERENRAWCTAEAAGAVKPPFTALPCRKTHAPTSNDECN
jgi:hypothetical protein